MPDVADVTGLDILAIAAHPDDAELGCSGALLLAADAGLATGVLDLTRGEAATRGSPDRRERERRAASVLLGLARRETLGLPDGVVGTEPAHRRALVDALHELRPRILLAPFTQDRHPDHVAAGRLAREACLLARVATGGTGPAHRVARLYHYELHHPLTPSFVVDVSGVWERKLAAVRAYESQFDDGSGTPTALSGSGFLRALEARAVVAGAMIGASFGEPYVHDGPLPAKALPGAAPGRDEPDGYRMFP